MQIFKGVPALFEYLLNAVEEKPEMLEKDDITMFKRTISPDEQSNDKKDKKHQVNNESAGDKTSDNCEEIERKEYGGYNEPPRTEAYEYGNSLVKDSPDKCNVDAKREVDYGNNISLQKNKMRKNIRKRSIEKHDDTYLDFAEPGYKDYEEIVWGNEDGYPGFQSLFELDVKPEEIKERTLMAERMLEDYNYKRT